MKWTTLGGLATTVLLAAGCGPAPYTIDDGGCSMWHHEHGQEHPAAVELVQETPFAAGQTWAGTYVCAQGETNLALHITSVQGREVRATFDFRHEESDADGAFEMAGTWRERDHQIELAPLRWLKHPANYVMVGLDGTVSAGGRRLTGRVSGPGCSYFQLRLAR